MWPDNPFEESDKKMKEAVKDYYNLTHSKSRTIKFISRNYGYTISASVKYLLNL